MGQRAVWVARSRSDRVRLLGSGVFPRVAAPGQALVDIVAVGADRELGWIPVGNPHLAAQGLHWATGDGALDDFVLFDVMGEALVIALVSELEALLKQGSAGEPGGFERRAG